MNKDKYIKDVLRSINATAKMKNRIKEDLNERIDRAMENDPFFDVVETIGSPEDVAREFSENLDEEEVTFIHIGIGGMGNTQPFEFKSKATLFGLPLVHINTGGRYTNRKAKGIIAIGDIATGIISLGGVSLGIVSVGGIGMGIIGIGGIGMGILGIGGVGIGLQAIGGVAVGLMESFGAVALVRNIGSFLGL